MWIFRITVVLRSNVIYESLTPRDFAIIELPREPLVSFLAVVVVARDRVHLEARALARLLSSPHLARIVVAIDPAATSGEDADETGIVVVGKDHQGHGYVLGDASGRHQPAEWAKIAVAAYRAHHADRIVAERN